MVNQQLRKVNRWFIDTVLSLPLKVASVFSPKKSWAKLKTLKRCWDQGTRGQEHASIPSACPYCHLATSIVRGRVVPHRAARQQQRLRHGRPPRPIPSLSWAQRAAQSLQCVTGTNIEDGLATDRPMSDIPWKRERVQGTNLYYKMPASDPWSLDSVAGLHVDAAHCMLCILGMFY